MKNIRVLVVAALGNLSLGCMLRGSRRPVLGARLVALVAIAALGGMVQTAHAANGTWLNTGVTNGNWNTTSNWVGGTVPGATAAITGTNADASIATFNTALGTFGTSVSPILIDSASENIKGITFDSAAGNYFIGTTGGNPLFLTTAGTIQIPNTLTTTNAVETINAPLVIEGAGGTLMSSASGGLTSGGASYYLANNTNYTATLTATNTAVSIGTQTSGTALVNNAFWIGNKLLGTSTAGVDNAMALSNGPVSNWSTTTPTSLFQAMPPSIPGPVSST